MLKKDTLIILIPTFIIVIAWIIFSIYHNSVNSTLSKQQTMKIIPISSSFDIKTIEQLKQREKFEPLYQTASNTAKIVPSLTVTTKPAMDNLATASGQNTGIQNLLQKSINQ